MRTDDVSSVQRQTGANSPAKKIADPNKEAQEIRERSEKSGSSSLSSGTKLGSKEGGSQLHSKSIEAPGESKNKVDTSA